MISSKPMHERRKDPRSENNIPVKICQEGGDLVTETQNISRSGAYCRVNQYVAPMTKLKMHLLLSIPKSGNGKSATKKISCEGVVVRSESEPDGKHCNIAVFFSDISQRDAECLTDYVDAYLKGDEAV